MEELHGSKDQQRRGQIAELEEDDRCERPDHPSVPQRRDVKSSARPLIFWTPTSFASGNDDRDRGEHSRYGCAPNRRSNSNTNDEKRSKQRSDHRPKVVPRALHAVGTTERRRRSQLREQRISGRRANSTRYPRDRSKDAQFPDPRGEANRTGRKCSSHISTDSQSLTTARAVCRRTAHEAWRLP